MHTVLCLHVWPCSSAPLLVLASRPDAATHYVAGYQWSLASSASFGANLAIAHSSFFPSWFLPTIPFLLIRVLDHAMHVIPWFPPLLTDTCPLSRPFDVISTVRSLLNMHGSRKKKTCMVCPTIFVDSQATCWDYFMRTIWIGGIQCKKVRWEITKFTHRHARCNFIVANEI